MSFHTPRYQTLALAASLTALEQVQQLASQGQCDDDIKMLLFNSVLVQEADSPTEIFTSGRQINAGYQIIKRCFEHGIGQSDKQVLGYWLGIQRLCRMLSKHPSMKDEIGRELTKIEAQRTYTTACNLSRPLGELYSATLSRLPYRIHVYGKACYLADQDIKSTTRALLLSSLRASILWRQLGGSIPRLLWNRNHYLREAQSALEN